MDLALIIFSALGIIVSTITLVEASIQEPLSRKKRVIKGTLSSIVDFPYVVALELNRSAVCGGSIISSSHIITAAHCFKLDKNLNAYQVRAGSAFRGRGGTLHRIRTITIHEDYKNYKYGSTKKPDLAILSLVEPIIFDNRTKKAITMFRSYEKSRNASTAVVAGWGCIRDIRGPYPNQLQSLKMKIVGKQDCTEIYKNYAYPLREGQICASALSHNNVTRGVCEGDSGGPLVIDGKLAGVIVNIGRSYDSKLWPNKFMEIAHYRDWIDQSCGTSDESLSYFIVGTVLCVFFLLLTCLVYSITQYCSNCVKSI